jgi:hypothetical protein
MTCHTWKSSSFPSEAVSVPGTASGRAHLLRGGPQLRSRRKLGVGACSPVGRDSGRRARDTRLRLRRRPQHAYRTAGACLFAVGAAGDVASVQWRQAGTDSLPSGPARPRHRRLRPSRALTVRAVMTAPQENGERAGAFEAGQRLGTPETHSCGRLRRQPTKPPAALTSAGG